MLHQALAGKPLTVHGDGNQTRSFTWIGDMTEALLKAGFTDTAADDGSSLAGASWNVGMPVETSIAQLAELIKDVTGAEITTVRRNGYRGDSARRLPDISAAERQLEWFPMVGLREGLERTYRWLQAAE
jgi:nucleoside-diphosphate-sugar epimerase